MSRENISNLVEHVRLPKGAEEEVVIDKEEKELIFATAQQGRDILKRHFMPELGVMPSENPEENFYNQLWARDAAHFVGNLPEDFVAAWTSLATLFKHQKESGMLPFRVEQEYMMIKLVPGLRRLAEPLFNLIEKKIRRRDQRPVYEGGDFSGAEDTVPVVLIAVGEFFNAGDEGKKFFEEHFEKISHAIDFFSQKIDTKDGLVETQAQSPDWEDSIDRAGKLGGINVYWFRALRLMEFMCRQTGRTTEADKYKKLAAKTNKSIRAKLYDEKTGCVASATDDNRIDTVASVYSGLYLLSPSETAQMERTLKKPPVMSPSGFLMNFDRPYPSEQKQTAHKFIGHTGYHDKYVWPWVTCQNIQDKIKIALQHPDSKIRQQNKEEAVADLLLAAQNFKANDGAYEILDPKTGKPAISRTYKPPKNLMGNWAAFLGAYEQMVKLGWLKE